MLCVVLVAVLGAALVGPVAPASAATARIVSGSPRNGATGVPLDTSVTLQPSVSVDPGTVSGATFQVLAPDGSPVSGTYNSDAAGGIVSFTPLSSLAPTTTYTVRVTSGLRALDGQAFDPYTSSFRTGTSAVTPDLGLTLDRRTVAAITGPSVLLIGPDQKLYVGTGVGEIHRYTLDGEGLPVGQPQVFKPFGSFRRTITGMHFDPGSTASNLRLWVSHGALGFNNMANFTGTVSLLTGSNLGTVRDRIVGLPRSVHDHMNNGIDFDPSGKLYVSVGSLSGYGAPDGYWGMREETPLSGAVLVADLRNPAFSGGATVDVDTSKGYDPSAANAPVKVFASGLRNAYDLLWTRVNGVNRLYTAGNESAGGNTPAGPGGVPPALTGLGSGDDFFTVVRAGGYYGHPNPSIGKYVLNGGNPTSGRDPFEVPRYPVGTRPDPDWVRPSWNLGPNRSPNGITRFTSDLYGAALKDKVLVAEFSSGDDILAIQLNSGGGVANVRQVAAGFNNPLDVWATPDGRIYVAEYGEQPSGAGGRVTLLTKSTLTTTPVARIDFGDPASVVAAGYTKDSGAPFDATRGFGWIRADSAEPLDLSANGRERNATGDQRLDTILHMQYEGDPASGNPTPGRWEMAVRNGLYDVKVAVGDPADNGSSLNRMTVEGALAVDGFRPGSSNKIKEGVVRVRVTDNRLTLDPVGGTNTKIAYVDVDLVNDGTVEPLPGPPPPVGGDGEQDPPPPAPGVGVGSRYVAVEPARVLDTRNGFGQPAPGPVPPGGVIDLAVAGQAGVAAGATAVVLNVTATGAADAGFVQVFPSGGALVGSSSNLNLERAGQTIPNLVVVPIGANGAVSFYSQSGTELVADVFGYFTPAGGVATDGRLVPLAPTRVLDTRTGWNAPEVAPLAPGGVLRLGLADVPADARAVVLNVTATEAAADGFVQVLPAGHPGLGVWSNLNVAAGQTIANMVVVPVSGGAVDLHVQSQTHLVADLLGYLTGDSAPPSGSGLFVPLTPARLFDSRSGDAPGPGTAVDVDPRGQHGIRSEGVGAVLLNVTATLAGAPGFVQVLPTGRAELGGSSNLNVERAGQTIPNAAVAVLGDGGRFSLFTQSGTHLLADASGWFTG